MTRQKKLPILAMAISLIALRVLPALGEELILKSGEKITGAIIGYEKGMFRVETDFGVALVRKDKVASINFQSAGSKDRQEPGNEKNAKPEAKLPSSGTEKASGSGHAEAAARTESESGIAKATGSEAPAAVAKSEALRAETSPVKLEQAVRTPNQAGSPSAAPAHGPLKAPKPLPVSRPLDEPLPAHIQDRVEGILYLNDTFQFSMYKPPNWKIYEGVPKETGYGIMAMGTDDEQTLLIVDRQVWSGPPDLKADGTGEKLRQSYAEYQNLSESVAQVDGRPATRRLFKGVLEGVEWHGVSAHLTRGNIVFGIIGLTSAETYEFQQAVFNKIINSFRFLPENSPAALRSEGRTTP